MKKFPVIVAIIAVLGTLAVAYIFLFPKWTGNSADNNETKTAEHIDNATLIYKESIRNLSKGDLKLQIKENKTVSKPEIRYTSQRNYTVSIDRSDPSDPRYHQKNEMCIGSHTFFWEEYRLQSEQYWIVSGLAFQSVTKNSSELNYYIETDSIAALDHNLYANITATEAENGYQFIFSDASKLESWVSEKPEHIEYIRATALLSADNQLISYTYAAAWLNGSERIEVSYEVLVEQMEVTVELPASENGYLPLTQIQAPISLELATGILLQAPVVSAEYHEDIYVEALGDRRVRDISLILNNQDSLTASFTTTTTTKDSRLDRPTVTVKEEVFADGKYTVGQNKTESSFDPSVDKEVMLRYIQNQLISTIMLPQYIADCHAETVGTNIRYTFTGNAAFADFLCRNAGQQLYGDPTLLNNEMVDIKTDHLTCYLEVDKDSGLPIASGVSFAGSFETEGLPYQFIYEVSQRYQYNTSDLSN